MCTVAMRLGSRLAPLSELVNSFECMLQVNIIRTVEVELENKLRDLRDLAKEETVKLRKWKACHGDAVKKLQDIHQQSEGVCMHCTFEGCRSHNPASSTLSVLEVVDGKPAVGISVCGASGKLHWLCQTTISATMQAGMMGKWTSP